MVKKPTIESLNKRIDLLVKNSKADRKVIASHEQLIDALLLRTKEEKPIAKTSTTTVSKTVNEYPHLIEALALTSRKGTVSVSSNGNATLKLPYVRDEAWTECNSFMTSNKGRYFKGMYIFKGMKELPTKVSKFLEAQSIQLDKV